MTLSGLTALVMGSGGGVGRGIALALASAGAHVIVATRSEAGLAVADQISSRGGAATWARCDVTDSATVAEAVDVAVTGTGRLDAVVHNATSNLSSQPHQLGAVDRALWEGHFSTIGLFACHDSGDRGRPRNGRPAVAPDSAGTHRRSGTRHRISGRLSGRPCREICHRSNPWRRRWSLHESLTSGSENARSLIRI